MSGLLHFPKGQTAPPNIAGMRLPTSMYSLPIPIVYGAARLAGNLIHFPDAPAILAGSKLQRRTKGSDNTNRYFAPVLVALCEGPIVGIGSVWTDKASPEDFASILVPEGWSLVLGTSGQLEWTYLTTKHPDQALRYPSVAYVTHQSLELPSGSMPAFSWEINGLFQIGGGILDANPRDVIVDFLTDTTHGLLWPTSRLADLTTYHDYVTAAGLFMSPAFTEQKSAKEHLQDLISATNSAVVWSDGVLKIVPYGDTSLTGHGATYTPNTTPLYDLTDDDFLADNGQDPVKCTRKPGVEAYNQIYVEFEARDRAYSTDVVEAKIESDILQYGLRPAPKVSLPAIKDRSTARHVAQLVLQRLNAIRDTYQFRLGWRYSLLEPMDLVTLTDDGLGLNRTPVRIIEMVESEDEKGFDVTAEEWPFGVATATRYSPQGAFGYTSNVNVAPGNTSTPVIFEGPFPNGGDSPLELWIAASGGSAWGGCDVWVSSDNAQFYRVGRIIGKAAFGVLTSALASGPELPAVDGTNTLAVDLTASGGALASGVSSDIETLLTLCWVGGEFLSYQTATLTSALHYSLAPLGRGAFNSTIPASHAIAAPFVRCDDLVLKYEFPQGANGQVLYFKLPAFNIYGKALQDISTVSSFAHTISGKPASTGSGLAMRIHQRDASDESVELDVYVSDANPDSMKPITVQSRGFGVNSVLGEDGTQGAILGSRGNLHGNAAGDLTQWSATSDTGTVPITATVDHTVAGPDGKIGRVWKIVAGGPAYLIRDPVSANFSGVQVSARVWAKTDSGSPTMENAALTNAGARLATGSASLSSDWQLLSCTGSAVTTSTVLRHILYLPAGGTAYVWQPAIIRGTFAPVTDDLDTTDFVKFTVERADMQTTATNIVRGNDALDANNWINSGSVVITPNVATYAGHNFSRLAQTNPASAAYIQDLTGIDTDGVYALSVWYHHDGHTGRDVHVLWDGTIPLSRAEWFVDYNADGSITITPIAGVLTTTNETDGVVRVDVVSSSMIAANLNQLYACDIAGGGLGAAGVTSQLQSGWMLVKGASPFPQPITTTTQAVTRTVDNPAGAVALTALRDGTAQVAQTIVIPPRGTLPASSAAFTLEGEASSRDGSGDGQVRLIATFDARTESMNVYVSESAASAGASPTSDGYSGTITRHEGVIASDENWRTEYDIATTPGWYRQISVDLVQPGGSSRNLQFRMPLSKYFEQQAVDVSTGPVSAPHSTVVTFSTVNGTPRATVSWAGDATSSHRIMRNGYWLTRLAPGNFSFVDDGLTVGTTYKYRIQAVKNGQTSDFDTAGGVGGGGGGGGGGSGGGTSSGTAQTPAWATGYPFGGTAPLSTGNPGYVNVSVVNPDALASTDVWMSPTNADAGPWILVGQISAGSTSLTLYADDVGASYGDLRFFYLVGTRPGWTDSASSAHKSASFYGDP